MNSDPLNVYGAEIVEHGIRFANEAMEHVQLGVFRVEDAERVLPGGGVQITGWDRSRQLLDAAVLLATQVHRADRGTALIQLLITEVVPVGVVHRHDRGYDDDPGTSSTVTAGRRSSASRR